MGPSLWVPARNGWETDGGEQVSREGGGAVGPGYHGLFKLPTWYGMPWYGMLCCAEVW